jgi:hypothetical protein
MKPKWEVRVKWDVAVREYEACEIPCEDSDAAQAVWHWKNYEEPNKWEIVETTYFRQNGTWVQWTQVYEDMKVVKSDLREIIRPESECSEESAA